MPTLQEAIALVHNPSTNTLSLEVLPVPRPVNSDEHLIRVHAVALTNGELAWPEPATQEHPIPGYEVAGVVELAPADSPFPQGTAVYARTGFARPGSSRPLTIARTSELGRKPANISWEEAATVPLSGLTAWQALFVHGGLLPPDGFEARQENVGKRVFITAAAGGVGIWAVQLAKLAGAYVVGTCGPSNVDFVSSLGVDEVFDYTKTDLASWTKTRERRFDLIVDCVGGQTLEQAWTCAAEGGLVISVATPARLRKPAAGIAANVRDAWFIVEADSSQLEKITTLLEKGKAKAIFDSVFELVDYMPAFEKVRGGHVRGKVVLKIS
jgi:NADPH:quinone reductase-like Zn-dependent oxidoreductase